MPITHFSSLSTAMKIAKDYDAVISLGEYLGESYRRSDTKYLFLDFDDLNLSDNIQNGVYCATSHITQLVDFIKLLDNKEKLLIHCFAGLNRSSAATIIARCEREHIPYWYALKNLNDFRKPEPANINPNDRIISLYLSTKEIQIII